MNVKQELEKIAKYIKSKIIQGDYTIVSHSQYTTEIKLDNLVIDLWTASPNRFRWYLDPFSKSVIEDLHDFDNEYQRERAYVMFVSKSKPGKEKAIQDKINNLQEQLNKLNETT